MNHVTSEGVFGAAFLQQLEEPRYGCFGCGDPINYVQTYTQAWTKTID